MLPGGNRPCVTGMGVVTPIGRGIDPFWDSLVSGRNGAAPVRSSRAPT